VCFTLMDSFRLGRSFDSKMKSQLAARGSVRNISYFVVNFFVHLVFSLFFTNKHCKVAIIPIQANDMYDAAHSFLRVFKSNKFHFLIFYWPLLLAVEWSLLR
jgi:hypothetical protein